MTLGNMENVELFDAGKKGRGLKATRDLKAGEVVFAEASFSAVVFDSLSTQVCHNCFRRQSNLHRCGQCKFAYYCDRTCQTACWDGHKQECAAIRTSVAPKANVRLAARVLWRMQKDTGIVSDGQLTSVDQLADHVADLSDDQLKKLKADVHSFQEYWPRDNKHHTKEEISRILAIINCNGFTLSDQRGLQSVGVGLFPNLGLVNHDCWPNCTVTLNHGNQSALNSALHSKSRIEVHAMGKILEGTELTVGYVDFLKLSADRQHALKKQYHFDCSCGHCSKHTTDDLMKAAKNTAGKAPSADLVKEVTDFTKDCFEKIEMFRMAGDYPEVAKLCHECLEKQENVLADTNLYHLRALSIASDVLSYMRCFAEAAGYAGKMVEGYMKLYHPYNAQLGMATMRAGVIHWHGGHIEMGHELICKAYAILMITHGPNHPITKDLEGMRTQTEKELKMFQAFSQSKRAMAKSKPMGMVAEPAADGAKGL